MSRVRAQSVAWGERGARLNSISPGVIATPMGLAELAGGSGAFMQAMVDGSGTGRLGTADDIAAATEFLVGPSAAFVTGTDLLVDGGVVGALDHESDRILTANRDLLRRNPQVSRVSSLPTQSTISDTCITGSMFV